ANLVGRWMCQRRCRGPFVSSSVCRSPPSLPSKCFRSRSPSLQPSPHQFLIRISPKQHLFRQSTLSDRNRNDADPPEFLQRCLPRLPSAQPPGKVRSPTSASAVLASRSPAISLPLHHKMPMSS